MDKNYFMQLAIDLANNSIDNNGGPFGAVIVRNGEVIAESSNSVTLDNDPTAHAEINAIRLAAQKINSYDLSGCEIYSSCEPCPMCLGAIYWARIDHLYFSCTKEDAGSAGFSDDFIYKEIEKPYEYRNLKTDSMMREESLKVFLKWINFEDKTPY